VIAHEFTYDEERHKLTDFVQLMPNDRQISILSSPKFVATNAMLNILKGFPIQVWISIVMSYLMIYWLNSIRIKDRSLKLLTTIDFIVILIGRGISILKLIFYKIK